MKNRDCHLTAANIAYMNIGLIKFLLPLGCFSQLESQVLIAGTTAAVFIRDATMFDEEKKEKERLPQLPQGSKLM